MITGEVSADHEAIIRLWVQGPDGREQEVEAVIDTGFTGYLTLPRAVAATLGLRSAGTRRAILADGALISLSTCMAEIIWNGQPLQVLALIGEGGALVGMKLLYGHEVLLQVIDGGSVEIRPLP